MSQTLRNIDLSSMFLDTSITPELPTEIFETRHTRRGLGEITDAISFGLLVDAALPMPGTVLGKYRIEKMIGLGGFGVVYRARHLLLDNFVAIKIMKPAIARERPSLVRVLHEEARFAARIDHPNVVHVLDVENEDSQTYIVMELVDGPDLAAMIKRRGALPHKMVLRLLRHVVAALTAGLTKNLIHRDVKPSNILLTKNGVTKLTDFGLARSSSNAALAGLRGVVGTIGFMAPEQASNPSIVDFRSDMYALGVTAYHALTGKPPFPHVDDAQCTLAHRQTPVTPPRQLVSAIPAELSDLVVAMMAKKQSDRPSSYAALDAALLRIIG
jgi:eukaryotic-like serine/threonine-protein kinase